MIGSRWLEVFFLFFFKRYLYYFCLHYHCCPLSEASENMLNKDNFPKPLKHEFLYIYCLFKLNRKSLHKLINFTTILIMPATQCSQKPINICFNTFSESTVKETDSTRISNRFSNNTISDMADSFSL